MWVEDDQWGEIYTVLLAMQVCFAHSASLTRE